MRLVTKLQDTETQACNFQQLLAQVVVDAALSSVRGCANPGKLNFLFHFLSDLTSGVS